MVHGPANNENNSDAISLTILVVSDTKIKEENMSLAVVHTRAHVGIDAPLVRVEVHLSSGLPAVNIVGLAETTVRESKDRVRSAIINAGFDYPMQRITINLAPADLPKEGGRFDLAIAMGLSLIHI